ncbi:cytochrome b-c1 complex subunit 7 [Halteromyces radiatus]|uniref:cytochrome b-c1 complex subunit 7 n=1 Tax=Halteromyces radiatus TaxID=101107 RepID=UPI0022204E3B|nr:cytochrome b-c1 complex subunit 7 [Halteromyces radiatus]KAI8086049.1 cytochrome b-c1 complex subunit 7 [Halteromyces radiatus]
MATISLKSVVQNSKFLSGLLKPAAKAYAGAAGYQQIGLKYDDLISEENPLVKEALRRLEIAEPRQMYDRAYRMRVAMQCSLTHSILPKSEWTTHETDVRYLQPYIEEVSAEFAEREAFDNIKFTAKH